MTPAPAQSGPLLTTGRDAWPCEARSILGLRIHATSYPDATARIIRWAKAGESRYVCAANVHTLMEARDSRAMHDAVNRADIVAPDGMPLVWMLRRLGAAVQGRTYGPDLTMAVCQAAARERIPIGFFGSTPSVLEECVDRTRRRFPNLEVAFSSAPPFRALNPEEDRACVERINLSGTRILFVGLGCPKQELWMADHAGRLGAVMLGVGAAFDFIAGRKKQAPTWMQRAGLEWLFRLCSEPRRLFRRYVYHNPRFVVLAGLQLAGLAFRCRDIGGSNH